MFVISEGKTFIGGRFPLDSNLTHICFIVSNKSPIGLSSNLSSPVRVMGPCLLSNIKAARNLIQVHDCPIYNSKSQPFILFSHHSTIISSQSLSISSPICFRAFIICLVSSDTRNPLSLLVQFANEASMKSLLVIDLEPGRVITFIYSDIIIKCKI